MDAEITGVIISGSSSTSLVTEAAGQQDGGTAVATLVAVLYCSTLIIQWQWSVEEAMLSVSD